MGAGVTEIISLFAGYLHLHNETARLRISYDEFMAQRWQEDFDTGGHSEKSKKYGVDEFLTAGRREEPNLRPPSELDPHFKTLQGTLADLSGAGVLELGSQTVPDELLPPRSFGALNLVPSAPKIKISYGEGGDQHAIYATQYNILVDQDYAGPYSSEESAHAQEARKDLAALNERADAKLLDDFALQNYGTDSLIGFASEYDATWKDSGETVRNDVKPGIYVNGKLQPEDAGLPVFPRSADEETSPQDPLPIDGPAQIATVGSNLGVNEAAIVDINHVTGTLVVFGDYFRTSGIVQVNAYADKDQIEYAGAGSFDIKNQDNQAFNIASFIQTDPGVPSFAGTDIFAGLDWNVEIFEGDLYDVQTILQSNWMYDNDAAIQTTYQANYQLLMGANEQGNFAYFLTIGGNYDVVIVLGDYHEINFIYQKNVLVDPDKVTVLSYQSLPQGDGVTDPSITTGANWLQNQATIEQFGTLSYQPLAPFWQDLVDQFLAGIGELDVSYGFGIPNFGDPTLDILVITGSVYDINFILQENVFADADLAIQALLGMGTDGYPVTQVLNTGGNTLGNFATIVHTGPVADYYIGGDLYEDEMLIQCEIVAPGGDTITQNDPNALVSELVAFTMPDDTTPTEEVLPPPNNDSGQNDLLGNVMT